MQRQLIVLVLTSIFVIPVMADKPEWAGKGQPTAEQKEAHKAAMEAKGELDEAEGHVKEKKEKKEKKEELGEPKGSDKQSAKKSEQVQKELDQGSDKGQESREENSKKWWQFWGK